MEQNTSRDESSCNFLLSWVFNLSQWQKVSPHKHIIENWHPGGLGISLDMSRHTLCSVFYTASIIACMAIRIHLRPLGTPHTHQLEQQPSLSLPCVLSPALALAVSSSALLCPGLLLPDFSVSVSPCMSLRFDLCQSAPISLCLSVSVCVCPPVTLPTPCPPPQPYFPHACTSLGVHAHLAPAVLGRSSGGRHKPCFWEAGENGIQAGHCIDPWRQQLVWNDWRSELQLGWETELKLDMERRSGALFLGKCMLAVFFHYQH